MDETGGVERHRMLTWPDPKTSARGGPGTAGTACLRNMRAAATALLILLAAPEARADGPPWPDTPLARLEALAVLQSFIADLLGHASATLTLERWCGAHRLARDGTIVAELDLGFRRELLGAELLWHPLPDGWEMRPSLPVAGGGALAMPDQVLLTRDNVPFSEVRETCTAGVLGFAPPQP